VRRTELVVEISGRAVRARYALGVLLGLLGVRWRDPEHTEPRDVVYGAGPDGRCAVPAAPPEGWDTPSPLVTRMGPLPVLHPPSAPPRERTAPQTLSFDVLYATYAALTAPWERVDPADAVGCPIAATGFLERHDLLLEPLVHRYAGELAAALKAAGIELPSPQPRATLVLTHDVDDNFGHLFGRRERVHRLRHELLAGQPSAARRAVGLLTHLRRPPSDPNDRFDDWSRWHAEWRARPTFFFAAGSVFDGDSAREDVAYDIRHPAVAATIRHLADGGADIGVHFSIRARESAERLASERQALAELAGAPVRAARHHWWALGVPAERTLRLHDAAGIQVDCSLGFNDRVGFRRGIAAPFPPFDETTGRPARVLALPTIAMDAALFGRGKPAADGLEQLRSLYRRIADVGGALVLDWHVHSANPAAIPDAAAALRTFMDEAVADGARLRTPLELVSEAAP
jgi:hypothetical protein